MRKNAIALVSGGLDSVLAARLVQDLGFDVLGLYFTSVFSKSYGNEGNTPAVRVARAAGIELRVIDMGQDYIDLVRRPAHGYGKQMNPCIDCKIFMLRRAKSVREETGASFIVTGEVLGQRPMSQRRDTLNVIERESGLRGMILRPLSAKLLPPTRAEEEGLIDRERLLAVSGRSRTVQLALAERLGITGYAPPAGGCLLTDERFAEKLRDLFATTPEPSAVDIRLLALGRHFRLPSGAKAVVGRNAQENATLMSLADAAHRPMVPNGFPGPLALISTDPTEEDKRAAAALILKYSKPLPGRARTVRLGNEIIDPGVGAAGLAAGLTSIGAGT